MIRISSILCLIAILSAAVQNRTDLWILAASDCEFRPTTAPMTCSTGPIGCPKTAKPVDEPTGCCSSACGAEKSVPKPTCSTAEAFPDGDLACPNPDERKNCCRLVHPLWADIPHKAAGPAPSLDPIAIYAAESMVVVSRPHTIELSIRPWGIHPSIASTVLLI
ncbi:MAG: hypothetical protein IPH75_03845 [bacterium]|nr:hypothetical protein [bacterium]